MHHTSGQVGDAGGQVHPAVTVAEREAVYRLRYEVYARELGKGFLRSIDHERRWIKDPEDEQDCTDIFYTGTVDDMTGSLRMQTWEPGAVPDEVFRRFSLQLFPGIEHQRIAEAGRLVVRPDCRGGQLLAALACAAFEHVTREGAPLVCFLYCSPGLIRAYMRLGFRPYPGPVIPNRDGIRLPMYMAASDLSHLEAVGSPLAPLMARRFGSGTRLPAALDFVAAIDALPPHFETDPRRIWEEVRERLEPGPRTPARVLEGLSPEDVRELCRFAVVTEIPAHKVVLREGLVERELYVVLYGRFEVVMAGHTLAELGAGDVLGEISFFQTPGERVATVRAVTPARVMVLERHFLERLLPDHPELALRVLFNLARIVSGHLALALRAYAERM